MNQLIVPFLGIAIVALFVLVYLILKMKKNSPEGGNNVAMASLKKELELLQDRLKEKDESLEDRNTQISEKDAIIRNKESQLARAQSDLANAQNSLDEGKERIKQLNVKLDEGNEALNKEKEHKSEIQALLKAQEQRYEHQKKDIENIQKRFNEQFEVLANKVLEDKTKKFSELNKEKLDQLLNPLTKNLKEFETIVRDTYQKEGKERHSLAEEVKKLMNLNQVISQDTKDLTEALKGSSKQQGDWGEMVLENILEQSGLSKGREYFTQESLRDESGVTLKNEDGKIMRPDVIVQYPDKRKVIIDSKVSLTAYVEFTSSTDENEQQRALKKHLLSFKNHIDELSAKSYPEYGTELDFVMMFVPIEGAYIAAMQANSNLWNEAYRKGVLLISPTNLIAALRLIVDMWDRDKQSKNAEEIAMRGGKLYEKFIGFLQSMEEVGSALKKSQSSYEKALNQLVDGRGNIINQAQKLEKLGIKYNKSKQIPNQLLKEADEDDKAINETSESSSH